MIFNSLRKIDVTPRLRIKEDGDHFKVEDEVKLIGIMITNDMKWDRNTQHITAKAFSRIWILRNLKKFGADETTLLDTRTSARYARLVLAPAGGWGTVQTLLGANKYSCILIPTFSYPYIHTYTQQTM